VARSARESGAASNPSANAVAVAVSPSRRDVAIASIVAVGTPIEVASFAAEATRDGTAGARSVVAADGKVVAGDSDDETTSLRASLASVVSTGRPCVVDGSGADVTVDACAECVVVWELAAPVLLRRVCPRLNFASVGGVIVVDDVGIAATSPLKDRVCTVVPMDPSNTLDASGVAPTRTATSTGDIPLDAPPPPPPPPPPTTLSLHRVLDGGAAERSSSRALRPPQRSTASTIILAGS
jgi:hypothetical protein